MSVRGGSEVFLSLELDVWLGVYWTFLLPRFTTLLAFLFSISTSSSSLLSARFWLGLFTSFLDVFLGGRLLSWSSEDSDSQFELAVSVGDGGFGVVGSGCIDGEGEFGIFGSV